MSLVDLLETLLFNAPCGKFERLVVLEERSERLRLILRRS